MANKIKKCSCGSTDFEINEGLVHRAELGEDGVLSVYKLWVSEIETIFCHDCGEEFAESDFKEINF